MAPSPRLGEIFPSARETRCALLDDKRGKEFQSRVPTAEQATPQCQCLIAHFGFVSAWMFSGLDDGKCLGQCDLFLCLLRINVDGRNDGGTSQATRNSQRIGAGEGGRTPRKD